MKADKKLIAAFDDLISEKEVIEKTGYTKAGLRKLRYSKLKNWYSINGKKIMYSKTELAEVFQNQ